MSALSGGKWVVKALHATIHSQTPQTKEMGLKTSWILGLDIYNTPRKRTELPREHCPRFVGDSTITRVGEGATTWVCDHRGTPTWCRSQRQGAHKGGMTLGNPHALQPTTPRHVYDRQGLWSARNSQQDHVEMFPIFLRPPSMGKPSSASPLPSPCPPGTAFSNPPGICGVLYRGPKR
jgi:hypothetical protein